MAAAKTKPAGFEVVCNAHCAYNDSAGACYLHEQGSPVLIVKDGQCKNYEKRTIKIKRKGFANVK